MDAAANLLVTVAALVALALALTFCVRIYQDILIHLLILFLWSYGRLAGSSAGMSRVMELIFWTPLFLFSVLYRNTVIVTQFQVSPAFETTSWFIFEMTTRDRIVDLWKLELAKLYRREIERIHPQHFDGWQ